MGKFKDEAVGIATAAAGLYLAYLTGGLSAASFTGSSAFATYASAAATAYGVANSRRQARIAAANYKDSFRDREITTTSNLAPRRIPYGKCMAGGNLTFIKESGENNSDLNLVITLSDATSSIDDIFFDGESIGGLDQFGWVQPGSKYWKSELKTHSVVRTGPVRGGTLNITDPAAGINAYQRVESVSTTYIQQGESDQRVSEFFARDRDYIIAPGGLLFLNDRAAGKELVITYLYDAGKPLVRVYKYDGRGTGSALRDQYLETTFPGIWTSEHLGIGICRIHVLMKFDEDIFGGTGVPQIRALLGPRYIRDIRTPGGNYVASNNAALVIADYLMHEYGYGVSYLDLDYDNFAAEANISDQVVLEGGFDTGQRRYTIDGMVYADETPDSTLRLLLTSNLGSILWSGGKWQLKSAQYTAPEISLNEKHLIEGPVTLGSRVERVDLMNSVRGTFTDSANGYQTNSYPDYVSTPYVIEDNNRKFFKSMNFPFVLRAIQAQRLGKMHILKSRQATRGTFAFSTAAIRLRPFDTFRFTLPYAGFEDKVFRVNSVRFSFQEQTVYAAIQEDAPEIYDENFSEFITPDPAPNTKLPDPRFVPVLAGFQVESDETSYTVLSDGFISAYVRCLWAKVTSSSVLLGGYIEISWKYASETVYRKEKISPDSVEYLIKQVAPGQVINLFAVSYSGIGVKSEPTYVTHTISDQIPVRVDQSSGNRLSNASFANNGEGWYVQENGGNATQRFLAFGDPAGAALPATVTIEQTTPTEFPILLTHSRKLRVTEGQRFCVQFKFASRHSAVYARLDFFDRSNFNHVSYLSKFSRAGDLADPVNGDTPRSYHEFFTVPDDSFSCRLSLAKSGRESAGVGFTQTDFSQPMFSLVSDGQINPPPWFDGPPLLKYTEQISSGALWSLTEPDSTPKVLFSKDYDLVVGQLVELNATVSGSVFGNVASPFGILVIATVSFGFGLDDTKTFNFLYDNAPDSGSTAARKAGSATNYFSFTTKYEGTATVSLRAAAVGTVFSSYITSSNVKIEVSR